MTRILAVDDGSFKSIMYSRKNIAFLIGVIVVDDGTIEKVMLRNVIVDGLDATEKVCQMVQRAKIELIMLPSASCAGFNLFDARFIYEHFRIPLMIVNTKKPDEYAVETALKRHFNDWELRLNIIRKIPKLKSLSLNGEKKVYFTSLGIPSAKAGKLLKALTFFGNRPEPLRVARLIAQGLGEFDLKRSSH